MSGVFFLGTSVFSVSAVGPFAGGVDYWVVTAFVAAGVFFIFAAFRQVVLRRLVLVNAAAIAIAVFAANLYLSYSATKSTQSATVQSKSGRDHLRDLRLSGERAYVSLLHDDITKSGTGRERNSVLSIDGKAVLPMGGVGDVLTLLCKESGDWVTYRSDHYGFRNPPAAWDSPPKIVAIGDSFTQGNCVNDGEHFVDMLREEEPFLLNLGQRGDGPLAGLATIREYAAIKKPPLVLWFYFEGNDMPGDFLREIRTPLLRRYLNPNFSQDLMARPDQLSAVFAHYIDGRLLEAKPFNRQGTPSIRTGASFWLPDRKLASLYQLRSAFGFADFPDTRLVNAYNQVLRVAKDAVMAWRGQLAVVYLPARRRFVSTGARRTLERYRRMVHSITTWNN
ncbi:MAG: hypothetical protein JKY20_02735, partial [Alphaproteobacteria bacterium]|nr:hypothetical protein [Alphaproteobacteria bacterium]